MSHYVKISETIFKSFEEADTARAAALKASKKQQGTVRVKVKQNTSGFRMIVQKLEEDNDH